MKLKNRCGFGLLPKFGVICQLSLQFFGTHCTRADDPVLAWDELMLQAIRTESTGPTLSSRNLAILHGAIYDAVNSIDQTHQPFRKQIQAKPGASTAAAAIEAGYQVMLALYPSFSSETQALYNREIILLPADASTTNGVKVGLASAEAILDERSADGSSLNITYIPSDAPGAWRRTPPLFRPPLDPQWRYVEPFCLEDLEPFVPKGPPAMNSPEYAAAFNEVKSLGSKTSITRTAEQSQIATFWSDFSYTAMPPGHWHEIAAATALLQTNSLVENARLFALISFSQADAAIVCWECKYRYNLWRPVTAIQRADEDGNPATERDAAWASFLNAPPFPEYVSGHSTFSKASATTLALFYGSDAMNFEAKSDSLPGVIRKFSSFSSCAEEVGMSRVYGGIHFQFANIDGKKSGKAIAEYVTRNYLLANDKLPLLSLESIEGSSHKLRIHGHIPAQCVLEGSTNLLNWQPLSTNSSVSGGVMVTNGIGLTITSWFYRVRELP